MELENFYLGTHEPGWLGKAGFRLCVARQRLWRGGRSVPRAIAPWMMDSGAYQELNGNGEWTITPLEYVRTVRRARDEVGSMEHAAQMDHMCEPHIRAKTGRDTLTHQHLTIQNYVDLKMLDDTLPWRLVMQGWEPWEYARFADMAGAPPYNLDLPAMPVVGLGGVCRLQDTAKAGKILDLLEPYGLRLHGFGFKMKGLAKHHRRFFQADSMAWSYNARLNPPLPECRHKGTGKCNNCFRRAVWWRDRLFARIARELAAEAAGMTWGEEHED